MSSDQTSIDSREKLMVELRNDLLSEATRIYYERRHLQIDLIFTPPVSEQEHLENLLRLDEMSSLLNGIADGFLTKRLQLYSKKPAFNKLWGYQQVTEGRDSVSIPINRSVAEIRTVQATLQEKELKVWTKCKKNSNKG